MKDWWRRVRPKVVSGLVYSLVSLVGRSLRIKTENYEPVQAIKGPKIICGWHGKSFVAVSYWRGKGYWVIISHSRDGEIQTRVFGRHGFRIIRGSTGRGGERALVESIRVLRAGATMAITPDGPRGPSGVVQGGVMKMAQKSGASLVPVGISARPGFRMRSWDRYLIPWPFAKAIMVFGPAMTVPKESTDDEVEAIRKRLESEIHRLEALAEERIARA